MQFNLCLSCGVPFLPFEDHLIDVSKLGNLSLMYIQKLVMNSEYAKKKFVHPIFTTKPNNCHMVHVSHHAHALEFMQKRDDVDLQNTLPNHDDGLFPFYRTPGGKNKNPTGAFWVKPTQRIDFEELFDYVSNMEYVSDKGLNLRQTFECCEGCNHTMTMKFWFKHILYNNAQPLIQREVISLRKMNTNGLELEHSENWRYTLDGVIRTFPRGDEQEDDALGAAVAYYLHMCLFDGEKMDQEKKNLYQFLCWNILQIACLLCEYKIGPENNKKQKKNQLFKSHVGTIELYISYFFWNMLRFEEGQISRMAFEEWHMIYFWDIKNCRGFFVDQLESAFGKMIVDFFDEDIYDKDSLSLVIYVHDTLYEIYENLIRPLNNFLNGRECGAKIYHYFLESDNLMQIRELNNKAAGRNLDTYLKVVGVDALFFRLIDTCRDLNEEILDKLKSFRTSWQLLEVRNVSKNRHMGKERSKAEIEYYMCKVSRPPRYFPSDHDELEKLMRKKQCSPWVAALCLRQLGAF